MTDLPGPDGKPEANGPPAPASLPDEALLLGYRGGDLDAATLLYFRYAGQVRSFAAARCPPDLAVRVDAEDIVQTVFRTFFRRAAAGQYEVPDGLDLWKLLLVISLNKLRTAGAHHRAAKRDVRRTPQLDPAEAAPADGRDEVALATLRLVVEEQLARLPPDYRPIVERRIEGCEVGEIAAAVGRSKRSVERVLQEFRKQLGAVLFGET